MALGQCLPAGATLFRVKAGPRSSRHSRNFPLASALFVVGAENCMRIRLLMPSVEPHGRRQFSLSALIDDTVAIDTGGLPYLPSIAAQRRVGHVCLTHSHIDHVGGLPLFLENVYCPDSPSPTIHASEATWNSLKQDLFNDRVWPDLDRIGGDQLTFYHRQIVAAHRPFAAGPLQVTPIPLAHVVPTLGYAVTGSSGAVLFAWDTAPFADLAEMIAAIPDLRVLFIDASFPNRLQWLADESGHFTPQRLRPLVEQLPKSIRVVAVHLKPAVHDEVAAELQQLPLPNLEIARRDAVYEV